MSSPAEAQGLKHAWPRVHLIYYVLALIDIAVILAGLWVSHWIIGTFEAEVKRSVALDKQLASVELISDSVTDAQALVVDSLATGITEKPRFAFLAKIEDYRREANRFQAYANEHFPDFARKRVQSVLAKLEVGVKGIEDHAMATFASVEKGETAAALTSMSRMQGRYKTIRPVLKDLNSAVTLLKYGRAQNDLASISRLRLYELAVCGMVALIVCCVMVYGHFIGNLIRRKYGELEKAHAELEKSHAQALAFSDEIRAVNNDVTALNVKLSENMKQMRDMQDEIIRKGKLAQLGQITATVAHELRNPLGAVRTTSFLLERKLKGKGLEVEPLLERVNNGIQRCDSVITQLLDFARSSAPNLKEVVIDDWLAKVVEDEAQKLPAAVQVEVELGAEGEAAAIDEARMQRVIINLISNASEAMVGKGDDPSRFTTAHPRILISSWRSARGIEIAVQDNGPGIPAENMSRIMEPLFTTKNFGTGLGLPAVEKIMVQHGGGLDFTSKPGEGARFVAWIPVERPLEAVA